MAYLKARLVRAPWTAVCVCATAERLTATATVENLILACADSVIRKGNQ